MYSKLYYMVWMLAAFIAVSCEDMEDTYDEFSGDGAIRYLGKCMDVEVAPGWERLRLSWKNNLDVAVKRTKITWQAEDDEQPSVRFIERDMVNPDTDLMDTIYLENLSDDIYTITVSNLSADSTESLVETVYARPYTSEHEDLRSFTRGITNFYRLGDKMAVVLDEANENLKEMLLVFTGTDGQEHVWDIKEHMTDSIPLMPGMEEYGCVARESMQLLPEEEVPLPADDEEELREVVGVEHALPVPLIPGKGDGEKARVQFFNIRMCHCVLSVAHRYTPCIRWV